MSTISAVKSPSIDMLGVASLLGGPFGRKADASPSAYDPHGLAAGVLVGAHQISDKKVALTYSKTWTDAEVLVEEGPQIYANYKARDYPQLFILDVEQQRIFPAGTSGHPEHPALMGDRLSEAQVRESTLRSTVGRGTYLYALMDNGLGDSLLSVSRLMWEDQFTYLGGMMVVAAEIGDVNNVTQLITFTAGLHVDTNYLYLFGTDVHGRLYVQRRPRSDLLGATAPQYRTHGGWTTSRHAHHLVDHMGEAVVCDGNVSVAEYMGNMLLSVQQPRGFNPQRWSTLYSTSGFHSPLHPTIGVFLGSVDDGEIPGSYYGSGAQLHPGLPTAGANVVISHAHFNHPDRVSSTNGLSIQTTWSVVEAAKIR